MKGGTRATPRPGPVHLVTDTDRRGAQVFAVDLAEALTGHARDVVAMAPGGRPNPLSIPTLGPARLHPRTLLALRELMRRAPVTVAHGSSTLGACAVAGAGAAPFVYRQISDQRFWVNSRTRRARVRMFLRRTAHVVALWSGSQDTLVEEFGVDPQRVSVIPNGVPSGRFPPVTEDERAAARRSFGLPPDEPVLLSIGALSAEKGVDVAVRALADLPDHHLVIVGAGPEQARLEELAAARAPGRTVFRPPVSDPRQAYAAADVVVLPSRGGDSMPAVLIEAGMRGIPAVATPIEGIVDIVQDGRTGCLVPVDDDAAFVHACVQVGRDSRRLGAAARRHCLGRYGIDVVAEQWRVVLDAVAASR